MGFSENASVAQWQCACLPSRIRGFDPLHSLILDTSGKGVTTKDKIRSIC